MRTLGNSMNGEIGVKVEENEFIVEMSFPIFHAGNLDFLFFNKEADDDERTYPTYRSY
ncbi:hypothetical protein [Dorea sp.]